MLRHMLMTAALVSLVGCEASTAFKPTIGSSEKTETAQLAAYAATAKLPADARPSDDLRVAAVVDRSNGNIRLYNFTDKPLAIGNVWVNRTYVSKFDAVPARGYVTLPRSRFFDQTGQSLSSVSTPVENVWIQWDSDVYSVQGPVYQ